MGGDKEDEEEEDKDEADDETKEEEEVNETPLRQVLTGFSDVLNWVIYELMNNRRLGKCTVHHSPASQIIEGE